MTSIANGFNFDGMAKYLNTCSSLLLLLIGIIETSLIQLMTRSLVEVSLANGKGVQ